MRNEKLIDTEEKNKLLNCGFTCLVNASDVNKTFNIDELFDSCVQILKEMLEDKECSRELIIDMCKIISCIEVNINYAFKDINDIDNRLLKLTNLYYRISKLVELINIYKKEIKLTDTNTFLCRVKDRINVEEIEKVLLKINNEIKMGFYMCESGKAKYRKK